MRLDHSFLDQAGDLLQILDVVFHAEIDGAHAGRLCRFLVDLPDQVDQHSAPLEHAPRAALRVSTERVEHHVDVAQFLLEALALVIDDRIDADRFQEFEARLAGGGRHFGALPARELRGERAHAAARAVDEEAHAAPGPRRIDDGLPGGQRRHGHRGREVEIERRGFLDQVFHRHQREFREAAEHFAEDLVAFAQRSLRTGSDALHHAGEILPQRQRHPVGSFRVVDVLAHHPVDRVHARRSNAHQRLATSDLGQRNVLELDPIRTAEFVDAYRFHEDLPSRRARIGARQHSSPPGRNAGKRTSLPWAR